MALDLVKSLKLESPATGGTQLNIYPTELDPHQDAIVAAGVSIQDVAQTAMDRTVILDRSAASLRFTDGTTQRLLSELVTNVGNQVGSHNALTDLVHFLGDGPGDGWASGAVCVDSYVGPLKASMVWYTDNTLTKKIVSLTWSYNGPLVLTQVHSVYLSDGITIARSATDTYTYSGPLRIRRVRTFGP